MTLNRAVVLVLQDKAVVEQAHPELRMRGAAVELPVPRVIRLCHYVSVPFQDKRPGRGGAFWYGTGTGARTADDGPSTVDHVMPSSRGRATTAGLNTVASCAE